MKTSDKVLIGINLITIALCIANVDLIAASYKLKGGMIND